MMAYSASSSILTMTVAELIQMLERCPRDATIITSSEGLNAKRVVYGHVTRDGLPAQPFSNKPPERELVLWVE